MEIAGYSPLVQVYMPNLAMARLAILESWRRCGTVDDMGGEGLSVDIETFTGMLLVVWNIML